MTGHRGDFTPKLTKVDWMIGHKVVNTSNEQIGTLRDLVFDSSLDRVSYAVVSTGGVLGIGDKMHAVPWNALKITPENKTISLSTDRKTLEDSPSFDQNRWPETGDARWSRESSQYWQQHRSQSDPDRVDVSIDTTRARVDIDVDGDDQARSDQGDSERMTARGDEDADMRTQMTSGGQYFNYRRATELVGLNVKNKQNENLGEIENLVIDMHEGRLVYGYIGFGGVLGIGEKTAAVPWSALNVLPRVDSARLDADRKMLDAIAFEQGKEPNLADRSEAGKLYTRFNEQPYWEVYGYAPSDEHGEKKMMKPDAWMSGSKYMTSFDPKTIVDFNCTVESVGTFHPAADAAPGIRLRVRTDDKKTMTIQAGPRSFAAQKGMQFSYGDQLKVTGSKADVDGKNVIVATKIQKGEQTLELRDQSGQPKWDAKDIK